MSLTGEAPVNLQSYSYEKESEKELDATEPSARMMALDSDDGKQ